ncbi:MAG: 3,4-dihydroxy-2-butanone-4-phosphate synthase, partial [Sphingomonas bacterium]|nr:3,4-dihydroxy-2-butanone-4-phosphate synthase [Sphingomonas bacterium]
MADLPVPPLVTAITARLDKVFAMAFAELARLQHGYLSSPEELIDEARNGRMFILVDDEDRENEGDLIIPAQMATPEKINFM